MILTAFLFFSSCEKKNNSKSITYYDNGNVMRETLTIENNMILIKDFYKNGTLKCISERKANGVEHGDFFLYYPDGALHQEVQMVNGKMDGVGKSFYDNGNLFESTKMKLGKASGCCKLKYRKDGSIRWIGLYDFVGKLIFTAILNAKGKVEEVEGNNLIVLINKNHVRVRENIRVEIDRYILPSVHNKAYLHITKGDEFFKEILFESDTLFVSLELPGKYIFTIKSTHEQNKIHSKELINALNAELSLEVFVGGKEI